MQVRSLAGSAARKISNALSNATCAGLRPYLQVPFYRIAFCSLGSMHHISIETEIMAFIKCLCQLESVSKDDNDTCSRTIYHMRLENILHLLGYGKPLHGKYWYILHVKGATFDRILSSRFCKLRKLRYLV